MTDRLQLEDLEIRSGDRVLVQGAALHLEAGEIVGLTGPSGAGKSLILRALVGLVSCRPGVTRARLLVDAGGETLRPWADGLGARARERLFRRIRGEIASLLPQDATAALDPLRRVGVQVAAAATLAGDRGDPDTWLERAGLDDAPRVARMWPHELSGGMAQRVAIAQALARRSRFILADEPTSGLDPHLRAGLFRTLQEIAARGTGVLLVTHDLDALAAIASRVVLIDGGRPVETVSPDALRSGDLSSETGRRLLQAHRQLATGRPP